MSIHHSDPTRFFSVVGAAYVSERHADSEDRSATPATLAGAEPSLTASWIALFVLLAGISIFAGEISVLSSVGLTTDVRAAIIQ
jgi:hypothetical protein